MSNNRTQDGAKMRRRETKRARKAEVWFGIPHSERRALQTAGFREAITRRRTELEIAYDSRRGLSAYHKQAEAADGFHAAITAPVGTVTGRFPSKDPKQSLPPSRDKFPPAIDPLRAKRSEAAKRAAATRKANRESKTKPDQSGDGITQVY